MLFFKRCGTSACRDRDTDTIAYIRGVASQMQMFNYFYGLLLAELLLCHYDNLSRTLQSSSLSAAEGQIVADMTKKTLTHRKSVQHT